MNTLLLHADSVLRSATRRDTIAALDWRHTMAVITFCGLFYGAMMGTWSGVSGDRWLQVIYSAIKVPLLMGVTFCISVPSFWMMSTLLGLRDDFEYSLRALCATQAGISLTLASLAPFTLLFYASTSNYENAILFNVLMFTVATLCGQKLLRAHYSVLIERDGRHRKVLIGWLVVFAVVAVQMAWLLRPFVGDPNAPVTFFRADALTNAYENLGRILLRAF